MLKTLWAVMITLGLGAAALGTLALAVQEWRRFRQARIHYISRFS